MEEREKSQLVASIVYLRANRIDELRREQRQEHVHAANGPKRRQSRATRAQWRQACEQRCTCTHTHTHTQNALSSKRVQRVQFYSPSIAYLRLVASSASTLTLSSLQRPRCLRGHCSLDAATSPLGVRANLSQMGSTCCHER